MEMAGIVICGVRTVSVRIYNDRKMDMGMMKLLRG